MTDNNCMFVTLIQMNKKHIIDQPKVSQSGQTIDVQKDLNQTETYANQEKKESTKVRKYIFQQTKSTVT